MPSAALCDFTLTDEAVQWSHMRSLMDRVKAAADILLIPYTSPVATPDNPFYYDSVIPYTLYQTFELNEGVITKAYLSRWAMTLTPWDFGPTPLSNLETNDELMFLGNADGCWCKTLWHVRKTAAGLPTLVETTTLKDGCCQTIAVPVKGDDLGYGQTFIPVGARILATNNADNASGWLSAPKCRESDDGLYFFKQDGSLVAAQRKVEGYITWLIKPRHFQMILDNIMLVVNGSCGVKQEAVPYTCRDQVGGIPSLAELILALESGMPELLAERYQPGCLERSSCDVTLPWDALTCGGQNCSGAGAPLLYCTTVQYLNGLIRHLPDWLCGPPCMSWTYIHSSVSSHLDGGVTVTMAAAGGNPTLIKYKFYPREDCGGSGFHEADYVHLHAALVVIPFGDLCKNGRLRITVTGEGSAYTVVSVSDGSEELRMGGTTTASCSAGPLTGGGANQILLGVHGGSIVVFTIYDNLDGTAAPKSYRRGSIQGIISVELLLP